MRKWISLLIPVYSLLLLLAIVFNMGGKSLKAGLGRYFFIASGVVFGIWLVIRLVMDFTARDPMDVFLEKQKEQQNEQESDSSSSDNR